MESCNSIDDQNVNLKNVLRISSKTTLDIGNWEQVTVYRSTWKKVIYEIGKASEA